MIESVEQTVARFQRTLSNARREHNTPAKARAYLVRMGILEKHKDSPHGVRLAKRFR